MPPLTPTARCATSGGTQRTDWVGRAVRGARGMRETKPSVFISGLTNGTLSEIERPDSPIAPAAPEPAIDRRRFIGMAGIAAATATLAPASALAMLTAPATPRRL